MLKNVITAMSLAGAILAGVAATPALAQDGSYRYTERYSGDDGSYYRSETYDSDDGDRDHYREYRDRDDYDGDRYRHYERRDIEYAPRRSYDDRPRYAPRRGYARCGSGTTGTILGAAVGGLLGREVGRGGRNTTGLILGAGAGALAGRAIEQDGC